MNHKYANIDEAYKAEFNNLVSAARSHLINKDLAIDCVHSVFLKAMRLYGISSPFKGYYLLRDVTREAQKLNKRVTHDIYHFGGSLPEVNSQINFDSEE